MLAAPDFAVIDVETTGFYAKTSDRIIEVGIVRLDRDGNQVSQYTTLINPQRDIGATSVHGIAARDVLEAPLFGDVVGDVVEHLRDAILVGHNVNFDVRFLAAELARLQLLYPDPPTLDTMQLSRMVDHELPGRQLGAICAHWGIPLKDAHVAANDAAATAEVFRSCAARMGGWQLLDFLTLVEPEKLKLRAWPSLKRSGNSYTRSIAKADTQPASCLARVVRSLPQKTDSAPDLDRYLALLDRVFEDRRVDEHEVQALAELAQEEGLSAEGVARAHREYLLNLLLVAYEDYDISEIEERDLLEVSQVLGIPEEEYRNLRHQVENEEAWDAERYGLGRGPESLEGKTISFTGKLRGSINGVPLDRHTAQEAARAKGMIADRFRKSTDFLVVADPYSSSSKARRAQKLGIRIIAESVFWRMVGLQEVE